MKTKWIATLGIMLTLSVGAFAEGADYLIITTPPLTDEVHPLAVWKTQQGFRVKVITVDAGTPPGAVRNIIQNAYATWDPKPHYVLLVGNMTSLPSFLVFYDYNIPSFYPIDYLFVVQDDSLRSDIRIGRIPSSNEAEVAGFIEKSIYYEKTPTLRRVGWLNKGVVSVEFGDPEADPYLEAAMSYARELMLENGLQIVFFDSITPSNFAQELAEHLNDGVSIFNHRSFPLTFEISPDDVRNDSMPFVMLDISCGTANFANPSHQCECAAWTIHSTRSGEKRGAAAAVGGSVVVAYTGTIFTHRRNTADTAIVRAIWQDGMRLGDAVYEGRQAVLRAFGLDDSAAVTAAFEVTLFGDPALNVWRGQPSPIFAVYPAAIVPNDSFDVQVFMDGEPLEGAVVTVSIDTQLIAIDTTDINGISEISIENSGTYILTVSHPSGIPYQAEILVQNGGTLSDSLTLVDFMIYDADSNGFFTPLDTVFVKLGIANVGSETSHDVDVRILTEPNILQFAPSSFHIDSLVPMDVLDLPEGSAQIPVTAQNNQEVMVVAEVSTSDGDTLRYRRRVWFSSPQLTDFNIRMSDTLSSHSNTMADPGDTVIIFVTFRNRGSAPFGPDARAVLHTEFGQVHVIDSVIEIGYVQPGEWFTDSTDGFVVVVSPDAPHCSVFDFVVELTSANHMSIFDASIEIGANQYLLWAMSSRLDAATFIDSILRSDGFCGQIALGDSNEFMDMLNEFKALMFLTGNYNLNGYRQYLPFLRGYLLNGGNLFFEGDLAFWRIDTVLRPILGVHNSRRAIRANHVIGIENTLMHGMEFWTTVSRAPFVPLEIDSPSTQPIFQLDSGETVAVLIDNDEYRFLGFGFLIDLLQDTIPPSTKSELLQRVMNFFEIGILEDEFGRVRGQNEPVALNSTVVRDHLELLINADVASEILKIELFDVAGRCVRRMSVDASSSKRVEVPLEKLHSGVYFVRVSHPNLNFVKKIVLLK